jgi:hypothetical protein
MSLAQQIAKEVVKSTGNARPLEILDGVLHTPSKIRGTVIEVGTVGNEQIVSVRTHTNRILSKLNAKEFVLQKSYIGLMRPEPPTASETVLGQPIMERRFEEAGGKLEGPISEESILDQLER